MPFAKSIGVLYLFHCDSPNDFGLFADLRAALVEWINEYAKT